MNYKFLVLLFFVTGLVSAQNLFINGDFEMSETSCPASQGPGGLGAITGWHNLIGHTGSADGYYDCNTYGIGPCAGEPFPDCNWQGRQTGAEGTNNYVGAFLYRSAANNRREYIVAEFSSPLVAGTEYKLSFFASLSSFSGYSITGIQWLFTNTIPVTPANDRSLGVNANGPILPSPGQEWTTPITDTVGWTPVNGCYVANGGERYLVIGNFYRDNVINPMPNPGPNANNNAHYYFDQFTLVPSSAISDASFNMTPNCTSATATITGDTGGVFAFNPVPTDGASIDSSTGEITGGTQGTTYTVEYTVTASGSCVPDTDTVTVTLNSGGTLDPSFTVTESCTSSTANITGTSGGVFTFDTPPTDTAVIDSATGSITGGTSGAMYDVVYTVTGTCGNSSSTVTVTLLSTPSNASFSLTPVCGGATANVSGDSGGVFTFNPAVSDGAQIDAVTGTITNGDPGVTYTIEYTVTGTNACSSATSTQSVTIPNTTSNASFTINAICNGTSLAMITGDSGGTFSFTTSVSDGATIDPATGEVTNAVAGVTYTIQYAVTAPNDCIEGTSTQTVVIPSLPETSFSQSTVTVVEDETPIVLTATAENYNVADVTIAWYFNGNLIPGESDLTLTNVNEAGLYEILVTDNATNCVNTPVGVDVVITPKLTGIIPQGISPNNDGLNDSFDVTPFEVKSLVIYNRFGTEVYRKTDGYTKEWFGQSNSGDELPTGTYYYVMNYGDNEVKASWVYINR